MIEPVVVFPPLADPTSPEDWERRAKWVRSLHPNESVYDSDLHTVLLDFTFKDAVDTLWRFDGTKWFRRERDAWKFGIPPSRFTPQLIKFTPVPPLKTSRIEKRTAPPSPPEVSSKHRPAVAPKPPSPDKPSTLPGRRR